MNRPALKAQCLCGEVQFTAVPVNDDAGVCHCSICQRWSAGMVIMRSCVDIKLTKSDAMGVYDSSAWGERVFCRNCGSSLFWRAKDGSYHSVSAAAFEDQGKLKLKTEIFYDCKPAYYAFSNDTKKLTEAETIALFTAGQDNNHG